MGNRNTANVDCVQIKMRQSSTLSSNVASWSSKTISIDMTGWER